jgi:hypothetical protein
MNAKKIIASLALAGIGGLSIYQSLAQAPEIIPESTPEFRPIGPSQSIGNNQMQFTAGWTNYVDASGGWHKTDTTPKDKGSYWEITTAPYSVRIPKKANGDYRFDSTNLWDFATESLRIEPPVGVTRTFPTANGANGVVTNEGILYAGAFPFGDLLLQPTKTKMRYLVKFNEIPASCASDKDISVAIRQTPDAGLVARKHDGSPVSGTDEKVKRLNYKQTDFRGVFTETAYVWDSNGRSQELDIEGKWVRGEFGGRKIVPCAFFIGATLPVYADDTFSPSNASVDPYDGTVEFRNASPWDEGHDAVTGTNVGTTSTNVGANSDEWNGDGTYYDLGRAVVEFATASLPDTATITSATIAMKMTVQNNADNDGNDFCVFTGATPAATTDLTTADYDQVGTIHTPEEHSDRIDITSMSVGTVYTWTLDASGLAYISKTATTPFGFRMGFDVLDHPSAFSGENKCLFESSDNAGTVPPLLTVNYTTASKKLDHSGRGGWWSWVRDMFTAYAF